MTVDEGLKEQQASPLSRILKATKRGEGITLHEVLWSDGSTLSLSDCKSAFLVDNGLSSGLMIASFQMEMAILTPLPGFFFPYQSTNCSLQGTGGGGGGKILAEYLFFLIQQTDM